MQASGPGDQNIDISSSINEPPKPIFVDPEIVKQLELKKQQDQFSKLNISTTEVPKEEI